MQLSLAPVTSHPAFSSANDVFQAALPKLNPTTRFPTSLPTELNLRTAVDMLRKGVDHLTPMTSPTTLWLHHSANAAIASAKQAIELLGGPIEAIASGAVSPSTGSAETSAAVKQARELITRATAQSQL